VSELVRRALAILWKDLLLEFRTKQGINAMLFFAALVLLLFGFALGPDLTLLRRVAPGLLWIGVIFTGTLSLGRTYQVEELAGGLQYLRLYPGEIRSVYLGKLAGNFVMMLALEAFLFPAGALLFQLDLGPHLLPLIGISVVGTLGFSIVGTFYAALTAHIRARELMLPVLLFPALIPVLLATVNATTAILVGDPMGRLGGWMRLLVAYDVIFFTVCVWVFPVLLEE